MAGSVPLAGAATLGEVVGVGVSGVAGTAASRWVSRSSSAVDAFANAVCAALTAVCASSTALDRGLAHGELVTGRCRWLGADVGADGDGGVQRAGGGVECGVDVVLRAQDCLLSGGEVGVARTGGCRGEHDAGCAGGEPR